MLLSDLPTPKSDGREAKGQAVAGTAAMPLPGGDASGLGCFRIPIPLSGMGLPRRFGQKRPAACPANPTLDGTRILNWSSSWPPWASPSRTAGRTSPTTTCSPKANSRPSSTAPSSPTASPPTTRRSISARRSSTGRTSSTTTGAWDCSRPPRSTMPKPMRPWRPAKPSSTRLTPPIPSDSSASRPSRSSCPTKSGSTPRPSTRPVPSVNVVGS